MPQKKSEINSPLYPPGVPKLGKIPHLFFLIGTFPYCFITGLILLAMLFVIFSIINVNVARPDPQPSMMNAEILLDYL